MIITTIKVLHRKLSGIIHKSYGHFNPPGSRPNSHIFWPSTNLLQKYRKYLCPENFFSDSRKRRLEILRERLSVVVHSDGGWIETLAGQERAGPKGKKIGIVGYWATSISTVRSTVLSKKVINTDLFQHLDMNCWILDTLDLRRSNCKITVYYTGQSRYSIVTDLCLRSSINMFFYGKGLKNNKLHQYMLWPRTLKRDCGCCVRKCLSEGEGQNCPLLFYTPLV